MDKTMQAIRERMNEPVTRVLGREDETEYVLLPKGDAEYIFGLIDEGRKIMEYLMDEDINEGIREIIQAWLKKVKREIA